MVNFLQNQVGCKIRGESDRVLGNQLRVSRRTLIDCSVVNLNQFVWLINHNSWFQLMQVNGNSPVAPISLGLVGNHYALLWIDFLKNRNNIGFKYQHISRRGCLLPFMYWALKQLPARINLTQPGKGQKPNRTWSESSRVTLPPFQILSTLYFA